MKSGSIGEMPPRTQVMLLFDERTASAASRVMSENVRHSGSSSKSQCDRLFGSFQSITASTGMDVFLAADVDLALGMIDDAEAAAAQHRLDARAVRNPPVRRILRVLLLDEIHQRIAVALKHRVIPERIVVGDAGHVVAAALHALENHHVAHDRVVQDVESEERMAEVVQHAHENDDIELLAEFADVVDIHLAELDIAVANHARGETPLLEVNLVAIDRHHARGTALLHLD